MRRLGRFLSQEKGTIVVLLALAMSVLAGFTALVTDMGFKYLNQVRLENALDSAVLAGVQELPDNSPQALAEANNYAVSNGVSVEECSFQVDDNHKGITGTGNMRVGLFLARILGFETTQVSAHAKARLTPITSTGGVVPFGVLRGDYVRGQEVTLKEGAGSQPYPGWFGALRLGGSGAHVYRDNIKYGYPEIVSVGDIIAVEPGNMSGPTRAGVEYRLNLCNHLPQCSADSYVDGCSRIFIVPIIEVQESNYAGHPSSIKVVGFGAFLVNSYSGCGQESYVRGSFINYVIPGRAEEDASDFGLYGSQLCD